MIKDFETLLKEFGSDRISGEEISSPEISGLLTKYTTELLSKIQTPVENVKILIDLLKIAKQIVESSMKEKLDSIQCLDEAIKISMERIKKSTTIDNISGSDFRTECMALIELIQSKKDLTDIKLDNNSKIIK